jgi:O-antigen ligase
MQPQTLAHDSSVQWRVLETDYALQSIAQHPWLGIGLANAYRPILDRDQYAYSERPEIGLRYYIHNVYLWVWVDMGLVGLIPFVWLIGCAVIRGFARWRKVSDPKMRVAALGITLAVFGQAISNLVAPNFFQTWSLFVFPLLMGVSELIYSQDLGVASPGGD